MSSRLGIDVGGTFTDLLLFDERSGAMRLLKTPSTPSDQSVGILDGIEQLVEETGIAASDIATLLHGTTVSTNIVLEAKGAKVGLLVTENFEQVLHLARSQTPGPLAGWIIMQKPDPLADLELTRGIRERMNARGEVITPLDEASARKAIRDLIELGRRSHHGVADAFIREPAARATGQGPRRGNRARHDRIAVVGNPAGVPRIRAYAGHRHERLRSPEHATLSEWLRGEAPPRPIPIQRQYRAIRRRGDERGARQPVAGAYDAVRSRRRRFRCGFHGVARRLSAGTRLRYGRNLDRRFPIEDGRPTISRQTSIGYYPIKVPSVDVHSVGAGGGSIAHVPMTGALRVGPESAGAVPGPACYGKGGERPTVTDANLVLGRLPPKLLGGKMVLDTKAAEEAVAKIARALSLDLHQAAQGILDIVNENMFGALRLVTVQKGLDPRDFALVPFGGAGPLHGNAMAMLAGCYPVIVPPTPGVLSALGFLYSDVKNEFAQTFVRTMDDADPSQIGEILTKLGRDARAWLREEGIEEARQRLNYEADVRYFRQGYEFSLEIDPDRLGSGALNDLAGRFGLAHERIYGFKLDQPVELVNLRAVGVGAVQKISMPKFDKEGPMPPGRWWSNIAPISTAAFLRLMSMIAPNCGPATASAVRRSSSRWTQRP